MRCFKNIFVICFVFCFGIGINLIYLENWFIIIKIYMFLDLLGGNGFKMLRCIFFMGYFVWKDFKGVLVVLVGFFIYVVYWVRFYIIIIFYGYIWLVSSWF